MESLYLALQSNLYFQQPLVNRTSHKQPAIINIKLYSHKVPFCLNSCKGPLGLWSYDSLHSLTHSLTHPPTSLTQPLHPQWDIRPHHISKFAVNRAVTKGWRAGISLATICMTPSYFHRKKRKIEPKERYKGHGQGQFWAKWNNAPQNLRGIFSVAMSLLIIM